MPSERPREGELILYPILWLRAVYFVVMVFVSIVLFVFAMVADPAVVFIPFLVSLFFVGLFFKRCSKRYCHLRLTPQQMIYRDGLNDWELRWKEIAELRYVISSDTKGNRVDKLFVYKVGGKYSFCMFTFGLDCDQLALLLAEWQATCLHFDDGEPRRATLQDLRLWSDSRIKPLKKVAGAEDWLADWLADAGLGTLTGLIFGR